MSFKARLKIDGNEYRVLHCSYTLQRDLDFSGRPSSDVRGGTIHFEVESGEDTFFIEWMCMPTQMYEGSIEFYKRDSDATMKVLEFKDAYCGSFTESFSNVGDSPMNISCVISAREIVMGSASLENEWVV
jgi:hypothetical protein